MSTYRVPFAPGATLAVYKSKDGLTLLTDGRTYAVYPPNARLAADFDRIGLNLSIPEPNIWELARIYGGQANVVYCAQLFERTAANELLGRAVRATTYDPELHAELDQARAYFVARGCGDYVRALDSVLGIVRQKLEQAQAMAAYYATPEARARGREVFLHGLRRHPPPISGCCARSWLGSPYAGYGFR